MMLSGLVALLLPQESAGCGLPVVLCSDTATITLTSLWLF